MVQRTSKFARKRVESSLGGEVYAFSEMLGHMSMLREFHGHFLDFFPGMAGLEGCESLFARLRSKKMIAEKFLARHFLAFQKAIGVQELDNVYWIPGSGNPADGLTKLKCDLVPLLRLLEPGAYNPGTLRRLCGAAFRED